MYVFLTVYWKNDAFSPIIAYSTTLKSHMENNL